MNDTDNPTADDGSDEDFLQELMEMDDPNRPKPEPWRGTPRLISERGILMALRQAYSDTSSLHQYYFCDAPESEENTEKLQQLDSLDEAIEAAIVLSEKLCGVKPGEDPPPDPPVPTLEELEASYED